MVKRELSPRRLTRDRAGELEAENALLQTRLREMTRLRDEAIELRAADRSESVYAALAERALEEDEYGSDEAFQEFLALTDPHLDKVRRFLLG